MKTQVLALNAFHGGSHKAFLEGWASRSQHEFTVLTLPAYKWKWRMRHAAVTFARQVRECCEHGQAWDVVFCTDMLNVAEWRGLAPAAVGRLPVVVYFHENQLTYPDRRAKPRDLHFAFTNLLSAAAADRVWFNSAFHRDQFLEAAARLLKRMPDSAPTFLVPEIRANSEVHPPGVSACRLRARTTRGPLRIVWAARWEHDKGPESFFAALYRLAEDGVPFRLSVLGESFGEIPSCFREAERRLADRIDCWGFQPDRDSYTRALADCDVIVSTARHEFFGIAVLEAVSAGCFPLVPRRLAYPETLGGDPDFFYDGGVEDLAARLEGLASRLENGGLWGNRSPQDVVKRYEWQRVAAELDAALANCLGHAGDDREGTI